MTTAGNLKIKSTGYFNTLNTKFSAYGNLQNGMDDKTCRNISANNLYLTGSLIGSGSLNILGTTINIGITGTNFINIGGTGTTINLGGTIVTSALQSLINIVGVTGSQSFVVPDNVGRMEIEAWGPGGGGAGSDTDGAGDFVLGGGGGGDGGYVRAFVNVNPSEPLPLAIGLAGSGGSDNQNGTTGTSDTTVVGSFGTITAGAGGGGQNSDAANIGGNGGSASATGSYLLTVISPGSNGDPGQRWTSIFGASFSVSVEGGNGGQSTAGGDSVNFPADDPLDTAPTPGGGGCGGSSSVFYTTPDGTKGANGLVLLTYFS